MTPALLGFAIALAGPEPAPLPPIGTNQAYQQGIKEVAGLLENGQFADAAKRASNLPKSEFTIAVKSDGVGADTVALFKKSVDASIDAWQRAVPGLKVSFAAKADLLITLVGEIDGTKTLALFPSPDPAEPALEAVVAVKRLNTKAVIDSNIMTAEANFVIGQYLGLEQVPSPMATMFRIDGFGVRNLKVDSTAAQLAKTTLAQSQILRDYAKSKTKVEAAFPGCFVATQDIDFKTVTQGEPQYFQFEVVNRGRAPLTFVIQPDCSCFRIDYNPVVEPGQTGIVSVAMSTTEFQGHQDKGLFLYTNDAETPTRRISVHGTIKPAYQFTTGWPTEKTFAMTPSGVKIQYFLYADGPLPFEPRKVAVSGVAAATTFAPYEGPVPGVEGTVKGYRFEILVSPSSPVGRNLGAIVVQTDSDVFPTVAANFFVQKGVDVSPKSIFLGDIQGIGEAWAILTGMDDKFEAVSAESADSRIVPTLEKLKPGVWRLRTTVKPGGFKGSLAGTVTVKTNDPDSPTIVVAVQGYVK